MGSMKAESKPEKPSNGGGVAAAKPMPIAEKRSGLGALKELKSDPLSFYTGNRADYGDYVRVKTLPGFDFYTLTYVLYGVMRYQVLSVKSDDTGAPDEVLWKDRGIQITLLLWVLTSAGVVYGIIPKFFAATSAFLDGLH